jgi:chromosomal replication initiator protein
MNDSIDAATMWDDVLKEVEKMVSRPNFMMWFKDTHVMRVEDGVVHVGVTSIFAKDWISKKFAKEVLKLLRQRSEYVRGLELHVTKTKPAAERKPVSINPTPSMPLSDYYINKEDNLNPRYTFSNFVVGSFNELAFAASQAIIKQPGIVYNPLFIYGNTGHGKTHLIQSIGNQIKALYPEKRVFYCTAERFANDIVNAIQNGKIKQVKDFYRKYDVLIMDDIQFVSNKEKMQEELFHLFNALYENNKQIVFSSDKHPNLIPKLEDRLISRFNQGMIVDIPKPDTESRMGILKAKAHAMGVELGDEVVAYLAGEVDRNIRELEGVINLVSCQAQLKKRDVTINDVRQLIATAARPKKSLSTEELIKIVADFYGVEVSAITDKSRKKEVVKPRQITMYVLREFFDISYPTIGDKLGGRDHTTIIHSYEKVKNDLKSDPALGAELEQIRSMF